METFLSRAKIELESTNVTSESEDEKMETTTSNPGSQEKRRFRREWLNKFDWLTNTNGTAYCLLCEKLLKNHLFFINRHARSKTHSSISQVEKVELKLDNSVDKGSIALERQEDITKDPVEGHGQKEIWLKKSNRHELKKNNGEIKLRLVETAMEVKKMEKKRLQEKSSEEINIMKAEHAENMKTLELKREFQIRAFDADQRRKEEEHQMKLELERDFQTRAFEADQRRKEEEHQMKIKIMREI